MFEAIVLIAIFVTGVFGGTALGYILSRIGEQKRFAEHQRMEIARKKMQTLRAGRRLPPREDAGKPIKIHRVKFSRR